MVDRRADGQGDRRKGNGEDPEDKERKDQPWPDDNVPRPPSKPPEDRPGPEP